MPSIFRRHAPQLAESPCPSILSAGNPFLPPAGSTECEGDISARGAQVVQSLVHSRGAPDPLFIGIVSIPATMKRKGNNVIPPIEIYLYDTDMRRECKAHRRPLPSS